MKQCLTHTCLHTRTQSAIDTPLSPTKKVMTGQQAGGHTPAGHVLIWEPVLSPSYGQQAAPLWLASQAQSIVGL